jgi:hypothetical protein
MKDMVEKGVATFVKSLVKHGALPQSQTVQFEGLYATNLDGLVDFLLSEGLVTRRDILTALSETFQVPWFDVTGYFFDHQLVHLFPKGFLLRNGMIPLMIDEDELIVVAANPADPELLPSFGQYVSWDIQFQVGIRRHIEDAVKEFYDESITYDIPADLDLEEERRVARAEAELEEDDLEKLRDLEE